MKHTTALIRAKIQATFASRERGAEALQIALAAAALGAVTVVLGLAMTGKINSLIGIITGL